MTEPWKVCAGDPSYVSVPGVVKPIACGSQERARLIASLPRLLAALEGMVAPRVGATKKAQLAAARQEARSAIAEARGEQP